MSLPLIGTGTVTSTTDIAWTGAVLTPANCLPGAPVVVNGVATFVATRVDTTHFTVNPPVANATGVPVAISPLTAQQVTIAQLNIQAAELLQDLAVTDANGRGLFYSLLNITGANDPGPTFLGRSHSTWSSVTGLYFDAVDRNNQPAIERLLLCTAGTNLTIRSIDSNAFASFLVAADPVNEDAGEWVSFVVTYLEGAGLLVDGEDVAVEYNRVGAGSGFDIDNAAADVAGLDAFDAEAVGYTVAVLDTGSGEPGIYVHSGGGTWVGPYVLTGPQGQNVSWIAGAGAPAGGTGINGDMYLNVTNGDVYGPKTAGAWGSPVGNIKGPVGDVGPPNSLAIGTVTVGTADAEITGAAPSQTLNLTLPLGPVGRPAGYYFDYDAATSGDPGSGNFGFDNATIASATEVRISETDGDSVNVAAVLDIFDDSTTTAARGLLIFRKDGSPGTFATFQITSAATDAGAYKSFSVTHIASAGTFTDADGFSVEFYRTGNMGATGPTGPSMGVNYTYSTTTADTEPGNGVFRLNSTPDAATEAYVDNQDAGGVSMTSWLDSFDDSTNTTTKGFFILKGVTQQSAIAVYRVTGSVVDGTGYRKLTLTYVAHGGTWTNGDTFAMMFFPTGDKGIDGLGAGDVIGPGSSVNNRIATFSGTTGKLLQDSGALVSDFATAAQGAKVDFLTVTAATDLDAMRTRVAELDAAVILIGGWDASAGTFPGGGTAQAGHSYQITVAGTVDGVAFSVNDRIIAITDNASTTTYASNWLKADYSDLISSVDGATGAVTLGAIIAAATSKATPVDGDSVAVSDSEAGGATKRLSWANIKATLKSYFDSVATTLTNKRITPRVTSEASSATPTINTDNCEIHRITALAVAITSMTTNLSGTPTHGQSLTVEITGTATRAITWGASFEASTTPLPTTTVGTDMLAVGFKWNSATSKWRCLAVA